MIWLQLYRTDIARDKQPALSATNSGFAMVKFERHWAIARAMLRVGMAE